jgi:hypothetical protein
MDGSALTAAEADTRFNGQSFASPEQTLQFFSVDCGAVNGKLLSGAGGQLVSPRADVSERPKSVRESSLPVWFARVLVTMVLRLLARYFHLMF